MRSERPSVQKRWIGWRTAYQEDGTEEGWNHEDLQRRGIIDMDRCAQQFGGQWATEQMMTTNGMGGSTMMGAGWQHTNGTYGMVFSFTTG